MDEAHGNVIKLVPVSVIDFFMESRTEASWVGYNVGANELEGVRPSGVQLRVWGPWRCLVQGPMLVTTWVFL